ncbi:integrin beta-PS isoform X2 [Aethina tumida]|nr:integrin beta-PS isoform X2 [Aethina tumida]
MQAIVCKKEIGWRPQARHLLVFSTDASFHIAGDGRLGGVIEPNDGQCHMINDEYVAALKYDYPSISHINHVAKINNINLVFAVSNKKNINATYHYLSEKIENSNVGTLSTTSSNVVQLISDNYNKIVDSVTMTSNAPDHISVSFTSNCPSKIPNGCTDVKLGKIIRFRATIKAEKCVNNETIIIKPAGLDEQITVKLNVICKCDCESPKHHSFEASSPSCSRHGDFACGVCNCNGGRYGARCECDGDSDTNEDVTQCQETENGPVCSDAGTCRCNECVCNVRENPDEKIYGKYCGCTNYNCHRSRGILCGGHGECDCGKCKCHDGWIGDACDCFLGNSTCIAPGSEEVCSGHGTCNCGSCKCDQDGNRYTGTYCQDCTTCRPRCEELSPCVECQAYKTGSLNATCETCTNSLELVDKFDEEFNPEVKDCQVLLNHGCRMHFQYSYDQNQLIVVRALKEKICSVPPLAWIIGVMVTVIIAGIVMLLIWKICTTIHDRREYSKFEEEKKKLKWHSNQNPLYKGATSSYANPAFKRQSVKT